MTAIKKTAAGAAEGTAETERDRRRPTINDIARLAAVSKKTVSRVINESPFVKEETRARVNAVIDELGYVPDPQARGLAFRRSFLVGMIYDNPNPQYVVNMQQGILDALKGSGYELIIRPVVRSDPKFLDDMRAFVERQKLFGVVLPPSVSEDERLAALLNEIECPYVRIASVPLDDPESMVVTHDHLGGKAAARHLLEHGHRIFAHVSGPLTFRSAHERRRGFREALAAAGVDLPDAYVMEGAYTFESGVACGEALLALSPRPTAIFTGNDEMASGVLQAARRAGLRVPQDLSVVGFDDFQIASRVWPPLTTVHAPTTDVGRIAADRLIRGEDDRRARRYDPDSILPYLVVRESSGPAPA